MTILYIICLLLLVVAGVSKAFQDRAAIDMQRPGSMLNSWKNKYYTDKYGKIQPLDKSPWWYLGLYNPKYKEKFPYSTTFLVLLTDKWHFCGFLRDTSLIMIPVLLIELGLTNSLVEKLVLFVVFKTIMLLSFNLVFNSKRR